MKKPRRKTPAKRNPAARSLARTQYRQRVVLDKSALGLAALMKEEPRDELTALFVRKLLKAVRAIAAKTAPEVLRRHDLMRNLDPERATRN